MSDPVPSLARMVIDCDSCQMAGLACHDCVVTVLLGTPEVPQVHEETEGPSGGESAESAFAPVQLADDHARAIEALAAGGLVPPLRLQRRAV